jgi:hypothetical protein
MVAQRKSPSRHGDFALILPICYWPRQSHTSGPFCHAMSIALNLDHSTATRPAAASRPSLVGLMKPELRETLMAIIARRARGASMRASQLWNWIYHNGTTDFDRMTNIQGFPPEARRYLHARSPRDRHRAGVIDGTRKWLFRFRDPSQSPGSAGRGRNRLYPRGRSRHALRLFAGWLHAHLLVLPHRHAEAGAQSHGGRDPRPDPDGARAAGRFPWRGSPHRWPCPCAAWIGRLRRRQPRHHQCRDDGHGRAALQLRQRQAGAADRLGRRRHERCRSAASRSRPPASCPSSSRPAARSASCWPFRCMRARRPARHAGADQQEVSARRS